MNAPHAASWSRRLLLGAIRCLLGAFAMVVVVNESPYGLWILCAAALYMLWKIFLGPFLQGLFPSYFARAPKEQVEAKLFSNPGGDIEAGIMAIVASFFVPSSFAFGVTINDWSFVVDLLVIGLFILVKGLLTLAVLQYIARKSARRNSVRS